MHHKLPHNGAFAFALTLGLSLLPFFFVPLVQDFYQYNKLMLLIVLSLLTLLFWSVDVIRHKSATFTLSKASIGFLAMSAVSLISLIVASPNKIEALLSVNGFLLYFSFAVIFLFGSHWFDANARKKLRWAFLISVTVCAVIAVYQWLGFGSKVFPTITYLADPLWTPLGSPTSLLVLMICSLPLLIQNIAKSIKHKDEAVIAVSFIMTIVVLAGLGVTLVQFVPRVGQVFLPYADGWAITMENLKHPKTALVGVGIENFLAAFTAGRQVSYNMGQLWNIRFATNATYILHIVVTIGLIGAAALLLLFRSLLPEKKLSFDSGSLVIMIAALILLPPSLPTIVTAATLILIVKEKEEKSISYHFPKPIQWLGFVFAALTILVAGGGGYLLGRTYAAEYIFYDSVQPQNQANGTRVYKMQQQSMALNPYIARFPARFSRTSLALANAIVTQAKQQKAENTDQILSDDDRKVVTQLIQQAIVEAKHTTALAPQNVTAWENLAATYQALIGVADGSDQWAIAAYQQAITLDPTNPLLRMSLGGIYVRQQKYDNANEQFQVAIRLKQNLANAYYNLANSLKLKGDTENALKALEETLKYVPSGTSDYEKASNELKQLQASAPAPQPTPTQAEIPTELIQNVAPVATTSGEVKPPIILGQDSAPQLTPTPTEVQ